MGEEDGSDGDQSKERGGGEVESVLEALFPGGEVESDGFAGEVEEEDDQREGEEAGEDVGVGSGTVGKWSDFSRDNSFGDVAGCLEG